MNLQGPVEVPQEITDTIIRQLRGHDDALMSCSLVSRSFLHPSRRNLFAIILLDGIKKTERLHELLMSNSQLSGYIRSLTFSVSTDISLEYFGKLSDWLQSHDNALANILRNVPHLRYLALGNLRSCYLDWNIFSSDLQSALSELFQSPLLTTIKIFRFNNILGPKGPNNNHSIFPHVKELILNEVTWGYASVPVTAEVVMPNLEVLDLESVVFPPTLASNLQHLFIRSNEHCTAMLTVGIIRSSSKSLEWIFWDYCDPPIDLGIIENLQYLAFFTLQRLGHLGIQRLSEVTELLKDRAVTKRLKELVISLQILDNEAHYYGTLANLSVFEDWKVLDQTISTIPTLQKATIHLDFLCHPSTGIANQNVRSYMKRLLPLSDSRGVLSIVSGSSADLESLWHRRKASGEW